MLAWTKTRTHGQMSSADMLLKKINSNGFMLLEFCTRLQLSIMGMMFQLKDSLKNTWQHLCSKHCHQLDDALSNQAARQHITVTKVNQGADCFADHRLLVSKCFLSIKNYWNGRSTIDVIFTLWQLMKNKTESNVQVYIAFVDFTKVFDTVNHELFFIILGKFGCLPKFIRLIRKLYTDVHARLIIDGELTLSFEYNSGVKQGCKLAPILFGIYCMQLFYFGLHSRK